MAPRIANRKMTPEECRKKKEEDERTQREKDRALAQLVARDALARWYEDSASRVDIMTPVLQLDANMSQVATIPGWVERKLLRNGFVMICTPVNMTPRPVVIKLDYSIKSSGGVTGRQLHKQIRDELELEKKVSLRMCPLRPWHRHVVSGIPVSERRAIPASDVQLKNRLGTTLLYYTYVHLRESDTKEEGEKDLITEQIEHVREHMMDRVRLHMLMMADVEIPEDERIVEEVD